MAYPAALSTRDINVLEKIKDPESDPASRIAIDRSLPSDPHIPDQLQYLRVSQHEREIVFSMQSLELQIAGIRESKGVDTVAEYQKSIEDLARLIDERPNYASARNNRAQALRRLYGDSLLLTNTSPLPQALIKNADEDERMRAAKTALDDLDRSVELLSPGPKSRLSPQAAKTLSMAHTQRAAIYHMTSKLLSSGASLSMNGARREANWGKLEFEEAASRDFALGGRYGNDIAKGLAVSTNPTAKLCGQIVREAMRKEYGPGFGACAAEP